MNKIVKYIAAGAVLAMSVSCDLNLAPKGSLSYDAGQQVITNASDLEGFEANILSNLRSLEYGVYDYTADIMVDYFNALSDFGNNYGPVHRTDDSFTTGDYDVEDNWANPYTAIKNLNIFLEGSTEVPSELWAATKVVRGEAYFARAYAYLHLARHFAKAYDPATASTELCVPLVLQYNQAERPARATVAEVYASIKSDLDSAAVLLAGVPGEVRAQKPTVDAVNALYARYYIDVKDYSNAASSAMAVINSEAGYALSETVEDLQNEYWYDKGSEAILQFYASLSEGVGSHSMYTGLTASDGVFYMTSYFIPSQKLVDAYDEDDIRFQSWLSPEVSFHNATWYNTESLDFYVFTKYIGNPDLSSSGIPAGGNAVKPFLLSEMYLIAAEAYLGAGNAASATAALNTLQAARGAATTAATADNIHNEWYRETVGEGLRFSCLKRWGAGFNGRPGQPGAGELVTSGTYFTEKSLPAGDYHYQWPIPAYDMQTNANLVQNDGYSASAVE